MEIHNWPFLKKPIKLMNILIRLQGQSNLMGQLTSVIDPLGNTNQHAYDAAARVITAMDQALDTVISGMGMVGR